MNVANKDLCAELYELSGWNNTSYIHECLPNKSYVTTLSAHSMEKYEDNWYYPAYDLGYLLRKLPNNVDGNKFWMSKTPEDRWHCWYWDGSNKPSRIGTTADTPEDAACKLAIKLFKNGILTKETA